MLRVQFGQLPITVVVEVGIATLGLAGVDVEAIFERVVDAVTRIQSTVVALGFAEA